MVPLNSSSDTIKDFGMKKLDGNIFSEHTVKFAGEFPRPWGTSVELLSAEVQGNRPFDLVLAADCSALPARAKSLEQARKSRCSCSNNVLV